MIITLFADRHRPETAGPVESERAREMKIAYKKIKVELLVIAKEADVVVAKLNSAIDRLEEEHEIFGGDIETEVIQHRGARKKSALSRTREAGENAVVAIRRARQTVASTLREII